MLVVATGLIANPVPGAWRRLSLLSADGLLTGFEEKELDGRLEDVGIPRHQFGLARLLQSWQRARVPPDVALALWLLRQRHAQDGCLYRCIGIPIEEGGPAIRYIQLAVAAGEDQQTDPTLRQEVNWLLERQLPDGSVPGVVGYGHSDAGTTARALRALGRLRDPSLDPKLDQMRLYLERSAARQTIGMAWSYTPLERTPITGTTSLAVVALIERGESQSLVRGALQFLLSVQCPGGGWGEVPGYDPAIHNTFNVVRALNAARLAGLLDEDPAPYLEHACCWFLQTVRRRPPRTTLDISYAIRLAVELDLLGSKRVERLALELVRRRRRTLSEAADLYSETEIMALAILELSRRLDASPEDRTQWAWRWTLPAPPPPFISKGAFFYEVLYGAVKAHWWVRLVDKLAGGSVVERSAGLLLGTIVSLGIVDDRLTAAFTIGAFEGRRLIVILMISVLLLLWSATKITARNTVSGQALWASFAALGMAIATTWILPSPAALFPALLPVIALRWLIIDVVMFTADRTGLLDRLLPR